MPFQMIRGTKTYIFILMNVDRIKLLCFRNAIKTHLHVNVMGGRYLSQFLRAMKLLRIYHTGKYAINVLFWDYVCLF